MSLALFVIGGSSTGRDLTGGAVTVSFVIDGSGLGFTSGNLSSGGADACLLTGFASSWSLAMRFLRAKALCVVRWFNSVLMVSAVFFSMPLASYIASSSATDLESNGRFDINQNL